MKSSTLRFAPLFLALTLAACGSSAGTQVNTDANGDVRVTTSEGTATTANSVPSDWPTDVPVYAGSTVAFSGSASPTNGKAGAMMILTTNDTAEAVLATYKTQLASQGWSIDATMQANGATIIGATKGTRGLSMQVGTAEGQTTITIGVGEQ